MNVIQGHAAAVLGLLDADNVPPPLVVLDGVVPSGVIPPYVVVYLTVATPDGAGAADKSDLTLASTAVEVRAYCHSVGGDAAAARAVTARVRAALLDATPVVAGRECFPVRHQDSQPMQRDQSTGALLMDVVDVYGFTSVPA